VGTYEKTRMIIMDMDKTEKNQEKFTCGEFEYQVIRSARKTMTLEVRRDGNVIVRAPLRTGLPRIKRFVNQKQEWVLGCLERTKEYREEKPLSQNGMSIYEKQKKRLPKELLILPDSWAFLTAISPSESKKRDGEAAAVRRI
jgi:predicted metal-dependent hydrolase